MPAITAGLAWYGSQTAKGARQPEADPTLVGARGITNHCGEKKSRPTHESAGAARLRQMVSHTAMV